MTQKIGFDTAIALMKKTKAAEIFTDRGWGDNGEPMLVTIIKDGDGQNPLAEISIETFKKLQISGWLGPNVLRTYKARKLYVFNNLGGSMITKREKFKKEWLTDAFFCIKNEEQFYELQRVGIEFGLKNPAGGTDFILYDMHDVSKNIAPVRSKNVATNLTFFPNNRFQKSGFWVRNCSYGEPKDFDTFIAEYKLLGDE